MKLYNTLTRTIDEIAPLTAPKVGVYTCGPTVYDYAHIGHWFNYVRMDTLIRALKLNNYEPDWVMNITDVGHLVSDADEGEDKLEKGARREGKTAWEVAEFYTKDFLEGMQLLNIIIPDHIVKATDHIAEQIALIQTLETKGFTYTIDDGVYYDTSKFEGYAAFARLDLDEQQAGARVAFNKQKRNPTDFALWKFSPSDSDHKRDMEWNSPWGTGFPGWHIECSAMSMKYLGDTLDIHTGGIDHIQVHHTNEIAQSEAATGKRFANSWMHSNHVMFEGEKISKSLGNGVRIQEIIAKGISPMAIRLHILESHYRSQSKFSWDSLDAAQNRLLSLQAMADLRWQAIPPNSHSPVSENDFVTLSEETIPERLSELMLNDLDTPKVLAALSEYEDLIVARYSQNVKNNLISLLGFLDELLGLDLLSSHDLTDEQKQLVNDRQAARDDKNWAQSDVLRDQLVEQGIAIRDTSHGAIWYRIGS